VRARQFVVPNFVDTDAFAPGDGTAARRLLGVPPEAFVVLCVAALKRHHKRLDYLIREAAAVPREPLWLVLAGAATEETEAVARQLREALPKRSRVLVNHPREQMPDLYRAADVFVLCSLREMLANASLEALASGLPVVMHADGVAQWAIGRAGMTLDMTAAGALAAALSGLMADEARRRALGAAAREQALRQFAVRVVLEQQLQMYREVLACP
jgi:glycosyltransferase involved in cell wall biosynthesis